MIEVYTDGSCLGNPGPGGWAYIIDDFIGRGGDKVTTNNIMEMTAVVKALEKCIELGHDTVTVYTDSNYVKMGLLEWSKTLSGYRAVHGCGADLFHQRHGPRRRKFCSAFQLCQFDFCLSIRFLVLWRGAR